MIILIIQAITDTIHFFPTRNYCHDITEILLKVAFYTITLTPKPTKNQIITSIGHDENQSFKHFYIFLNIQRFIKKKNILIPVQKE